MIVLAPLSKADPAPVAHVAVAPEQQPFCGTIAGHFADADPQVDFHMITRDGRAVGFFKIDRGYHARFDFAGPGDLGLRGVMIDRTEQGRGTGKAAMAALGAYLPPLYPDARLLWLTVNTVNTAAVAVYRAAGFADDGRIWPHGRIGPQHIMQLPLN